MCASVCVCSRVNKHESMSSSNDTTPNARQTLQTIVDFEYISKLLPKNDSRLVVFCVHRIGKHRHTICVFQNKMHFSMSIVFGGGAGWGDKTGKAFLRASRHNLHLVVPRIFSPSSSSSGFFIYAPKSHYHLCLRTYLNN